MMYPNGAKVLISVTMSCTMCIMPSLVSGSCDAPGSITPGAKVPDDGIEYVITRGKDAVHRWRPRRIHSKEKAQMMGDGNLYNWKRGFQARYTMPVSGKKHEFSFDYISSSREGHPKSRDIPVSHLRKMAIGWIRRKLESHAEKKPGCPSPIETDLKGEHLLIRIRDDKITFLSDKFEAPDESISSSLTFGSGTNTCMINSSEASSTQSDLVTTDDEIGRLDMHFEECSADTNEQENITQMIKDVYSNTCYHTPDGSSKSGTRSESVTELSSMSEEEETTVITNPSESSGTVTELATAGSSQSSERLSTGDPDKPSQTLRDSNMRRRLAESKLEKRLRKALKAF